MNFKKYFIISEEIKQPDIIDLYIMMAMPTPEDAKYKAIYDDVFRKSSNEIKLEIQNIILRELRHADSMADINDDKRLKSLFPGQDVNPYTIQNALNWLSRNWSSKKERTIDDFAKATNVPWTIDSVIRAFNNLRWGVSYGGRNWGKIAEQAKNLLDAGPGDLVKALDRFVDYVHNTGAVANKFKGYEEGWLNYILDIKAQSRNIRELIPYASYEVKQLFRDPAWRNYMLSSMPGLGSDESDDVIVDMFRKYATDIIKSIKRFDMWLPDMGYVWDFGESPKMGKMAVSHINLLKLIKDYGMNRVVDAINKAKETDPQISKIVKQFIKIVPNQDSDYGELNKTQEEFLKGLGWKGYDQETQDMKDYFNPDKQPELAKKKKKKSKGKKIPQKKTYWDDRRGEWVQTKA